jgi:hypothetical protein
LSAQLTLLEIAPAPSTRTAFDPMTDMWGESPLCHECGAAVRRRAAFIQCPAGHFRYAECFGALEHPLHAQFSAYRRSVGYPID